MQQYTNYSLLQHNTFQMDVRAALYVEYNSAEELCKFLLSQEFENHRNKFIHIGAGSNLLFAGDYSGLVLHSAIRDLAVAEDTREHQLLRVGAGSQSQWAGAIVFGAAAAGAALTAGAGA